jgi:hypothetical protein
MFGAAPLFRDFRRARTGGGVRRILCFHFLLPFCYRRAAKKQNTTKCLICLNRFRRVQSFQSFQSFPGIPRHLIVQLIIALIDVW